MRADSQSETVSWKGRLEYGALRTLIALLGVMPRVLARKSGAWIGAAVFRLLNRLRNTGLRNIEIAFPNRGRAVNTQLLRVVYRNLGLLMAEFCLMPGYSRHRAQTLIDYDGLENYLAARALGKGVLVLTGHLGAWELSSFFHSLMGYPMGLVIRRLDNPLVDAFVNRVRCMHGNRVIHKDDFARGLISAMRMGETVGILMDTNMTPPQGVFVPFFGLEACTASGLAKVALKTDAAVLPGFLLWSEDRKKYVLHFGQCLELQRTGEIDADVLANTALFTRVIERYVRANPEQWLWLHRRWKTRPAGEAGVY